MFVAGRGRSRRVSLGRPDRLRHGLFQRLAWAGLVLPLSGCASLSNGFLLHPAGQIAAAERHEFIVVGLILLFVLAPVAILVPLFAWHYRIANSHAAFRPQWGFSWILEVLIWLPPTGIVVVLSVLLYENTTALDPYRPLADTGGPALNIDVVALDWKWLFIYPAEHLATVNLLMLPVGRPVHFTLTSGTVMQSLFMPRLAGQIYAMAGMRTQLNFAVARPGVYWGENTQYNGKGYPQDHFQIIAVPPEQFQTWVTQTQTQATVLNDQEYQTLSWQSLLARPREFGNVEPGIFDRIVAGKITPGYVIQHHEGDHG